MNYNDYPHSLTMAELLEAMERPDAPPPGPEVLGRIRRAVLIAMEWENRAQDIVEALDLDDDNYNEDLIADITGFSNEWGVKRL